MNIDEAVSVAQRMKNTFRAFEFLEEFLTVCRQAQSEISNHKQAVEALLDDKKALEASVRKLKDDEKDAIGKVNDQRAKLASAQKDVQAKIDEYNKELDANMANASEQASKRKAEIDAAASEAEEAHSNRMKGIRAEQKKEEDKLEALRKKVVNMKASMAKAAEGLEEEDADAKKS